MCACILTQKFSGNWKIQHFKKYINTVIIISLNWKKNDLSERNITIRQGFSTSARWTFGRVIFVVKCPVHCRRFSSIPSLYQPDARSTPDSCDNQSCLQTLPNVPLRGKNPLVENHCSMTMKLIFDCGRMYAFK